MLKVDFFFPIVVVLICKQAALASNSETKTVLHYYCMATSLNNAPKLTRIDLAGIKNPYYIRVFTQNSWHWQTMNYLF